MVSMNEITIEAYGLQWKLSKQDNGFILRNGSLQFLGKPFYDLAFGPCLVDFEVLADTWHKVIVPARFYSKHLDIPKPLLRERVFDKNRFELYRYYDIFKGERINMHGIQIKQEDGVLQLKNISRHIAIVSNNERTGLLLLVNDYLYNRLPDNWTIYDLIEADREEIQGCKEQYERLWYDIAKAYAEHVPVRIPVFYKRGYYNIEGIYTQEFNKYGIRSPKIEQKER